MTREEYNVQRQERALRSFVHYMRNISNVCKAISEWAENLDAKSPDEVTWSDSCDASYTYSQVLEIAERLNLSVKEREYETN